MPRINTKPKKTGWMPIDVAALERMRQPGYHHINRGLVPEATPTDKAKYEICQSILRYFQENNISDQELKKRLECLLYCHIDTFNLDELGEYSIKLLGDFNLKMVLPGEEIHSVSQPKPNGRLRKHL